MSLKSLILSSMETASVWENWPGNEWQWNIPRASHMNGVVESLIKSVRQAIAATCQNRPFTEEQWRTTLAEIVYLVNSRPLYQSSSEVWEEPPITPNDLIIGPHLPLPAPEPEERVNPRNLQRSTQQRVTEFWTNRSFFTTTNLGIVPGVSRTP